MHKLVSVIIVTFNSSRFIIETLDSVFAQTWPELELVITDDCSIDNTIALCEQWLESHKQRFIRTEIMTVPQNTGISANCNRGSCAAKGEWVKYCAGDDALLPNCIEDNIRYIETHPEVRILFSYARMYLETFEEKNFLRLNPGQYPRNIINDQITAEGQYRLLLLSDRITFTPSSFINRQTQLDVGGFNEKIKLQEDYPLWLSLTKAGYKLHFMGKETVKYRQHSTATNNMQIKYLIKPNYFRTENFRREYVYPNLPWDILWNTRFNWYALQFFRLKWLNRDNKATRLLNYFLTTLINPFKYIIYFRKWLVKDLKYKEFYS